MRETRRVFEFEVTEEKHGKRAGLKTSAPEEILLFIYTNPHSNSVINSMRKENTFYRTEFPGSHE